MALTNIEWLRQLSPEKFARRMYEWVSCEYCPLQNECQKIDCYTTWYQWLTKDE